MAKREPDASLLRALSVKAHTKRSKSQPTTFGGRLLERADKVDNFFNAVQAGVALRKGYTEAREKGAKKPEAVRAAVGEAALPLVWAAAPVAAIGGRKGAELAERLAIAASKSHRATKHPLIKEALVNAAAAAKLGSTALNGVKILGVYGNLIQAGVGGYRGAQKDENKVRGFFRGALETIDPSAIFMDQGYVEKGYNALFGDAALAKKQKEARLEQGRMVAAAEKAQQAQPGTSGGVLAAVAGGLGAMTLIGAAHAEPMSKPVARVAGGEQHVKAHTRRDGKHIREHTRRRKVHRGG